MRTARQLLDEVLNATVQRPDTALLLFADDGVYEAPYLESLGIPWRYRGRVELDRLFASQSQLYSRREVHDVVIVAEQGDRVVAEYEFSARSNRTARVIQQLIVVRLDAADGKIALLRESLDLVELALALYPAGLAGYRVPFDRTIEPEP